MYDHCRPGHLAVLKALSAQRWYRWSSQPDRQYVIGTPMLLTTRLSKFSLNVSQYMCLYIWDIFKVDSATVPWNVQNNSRHKVTYIFKQLLYTLATWLLRFYGNRVCFFSLPMSGFHQQRFLCLINLSKTLNKIFLPRSYPGRACYWWLIIEYVFFFLTTLWIVEVEFSDCWRLTLIFFFFWSHKWIEH